MKFRYDTSGRWWKGNTHIHSTLSDGGMDFARIGALYAGGGYDFLFRTDHWVCSNVAAERDDAPLLWVDGIELDGSDGTGSGFHVVCLGKVEGIGREMGFEKAMESARRQGAILILAHPLWCGNSMEDSLRWSFHGVEIYNHVCRWLNGKSEGLAYWEAMLGRDSGTLGFASDDAHLTDPHPGWNGGWIKVNARECSAGVLLDAIRTGNYYSSCGPDFHSISMDGESIVVETSPVRFMRLIGPAWRGERRGTFDGGLITSATFGVPANWPYARLEIEDDAGMRAWSNPLFT